MAAITATETLPAEAALTPVSFVSQVRFFLWLASGMFSVSALALAFIDYTIVVAPIPATTHFLAAIAAAGLFALATLLKLGPADA